MVGRRDVRLELMLDLQGRSLGFRAREQYLLLPPHRLRPPDTEAHQSPVATILMHRPRQRQLESGLRGTKQTSPKHSMIPRWAFKRMERFTGVERKMEAILGRGSLCEYRKWNHIYKGGDVCAEYISLSRIRL